MPIYLKNPKNKHLKVHEADKREINRQPPFNKDPFSHSQIICDKTGAAENDEDLSLEIRARLTQGSFPNRTTRAEGLTIHPDS